MDLRIVLAGRVGLEVGGDSVPDPGLGSLGRLALAWAAATAAGGSMPLEDMLGWSRAQVAP